MVETTVVINCQSRSHICKSLLEILSQQSVKFHLEILESQTCPRRLSEIKKIDSEYIIFLDQDVLLKSVDTLKQIQSHLSKMTVPCLMTGLYLSSNQMTYLQKAYNSLTNQWILQNAISIENFWSLQNAAGGIWALKKSNFVQVEDWIEPLVWGGEDTRAVRYLKNKGVQILHHSQLDVFHTSTKSLGFFIKRAFIHGQAREKWSLKSKNQFQFSQLLNTKLNYYFPAWLIHFFFVFLGACIEKIKSFRPFASPHTPPIR